MTWTPDTSRLDAERAKKAGAQMDGLPLLAPHNGTETSKAAARRVQPYCSGMRREVLVALMFAREGLTREELVRETGIKENSVNGRCAEIVAARWATEDGEREGRKVLRITDAGLKALEEKAAA